MKKTMYIALGIIVLLVVLVLTGRKSVHHEITINASSEKVWQVLTNMDEYPQWNPVMRLLNGELKEGNKVTYQFTQDTDNISEIGATVVHMVPNTLLNQQGGIPLVLTFDHRYKLVAEGSSTTLIIHEDYRGIGVNFWNPAPVEAAYGRLNEALKNRAEHD